MSDNPNGKGSERRQGEDRKKVSDRWPFKDKETKPIKKPPATS